MQDQQGGEQSVVEEDDVQLSFGDGEDEEEPSTEEEDDYDEARDAAPDTDRDAAAVIAAGGPDLLGEGENVSDEQLGELLSFRRAVFTLKELNPTPEQLVQIASGMTTADEHVVKLARHLLDSQESASFMFFMLLLLLVVVA